MAGGHYEDTRVTWMVAASPSHWLTSCLPTDLAYSALHLRDHLVGWGRRRIGWRLGRRRIVYVRAPCVRVGAREYERAYVG